MKNKYDILKVWSIWDNRDDVLIKNDGHIHHHSWVKVDGIYKCNCGIIKCSNSFCNCTGDETYKNKPFCHVHHPIIQMQREVNNLLAKTEYHIEKEPNDTRRMD